MGYRNRSPLRMLAPLALVVFGFLFLLVLFDSSAEDDEGSSGASADQQLEKDGGGSADSQASTKKRYKVESGDTLQSVADKTGVDVAEIERLNPDVDPQALGAGQKIKLRE